MPIFRELSNKLKVFKGHSFNRIKVNFSGIKTLFLFIALTMRIDLWSQIQFNFAKDEHDFGVVEEGEVLSYTFEFTNSGKDTILLKEESRDVRPGCSCTASEYTKTAVISGKQGFIKAGYNTQGRSGTFNKTITVSQKGTPYKTLTIKGVVTKKTEKNVPASPRTPAAIIDSKSFDFGKVEKTKPVIHKFTLKNTGKDTLKILSSYAACNCVSYKLLNHKDLTEIKEISAGKTAYFEIIYYPQATLGLSDSKINDIFTFFTNDPKNQKIELSLICEIK